MTTHHIIATADRLAGERIRELRAERGWTQQRLAEKAKEVGLTHWGQSRVARAEGAKQGLDLREIAGLSLVFDVSAAEFMRTDESMSVERAADSLAKALAMAMPTLECLAAAAVDGDGS